MLQEAAGFPVSILQMGKREKEPSSAGE